MWMKIALEHISKELNLSEYSYNYNQSDDIEAIVEKINAFFKKIEDFMNKNGWNEDTVFQRELEIARLSMADMEAFLEIIEFYSEETTDSLKIDTEDFIQKMIAGNPDNIKDNIENNIKSNMANFRRFFENLENEDNANIIFSHEQKQKLDLIVDVYENYSSDIDCNKYRKILLEHTKK